MTKNAVPPTVVSRLAHLPRIVGIKDSSRDFEYHLAVIEATRNRAEFNVLTGNDTMLTASLLMGGRGTIAASANLVPDLSVRICRAVAENDIPTAREVQRVLSRVIEACRRGTFPAGWKAALAWAGLCEARMMPPTPELNGIDAGLLAQDLNRLEIPRVNH